VMISNQARNFPGRNGHPKARHYLGSADTVAASALAGKIADPR
jgi:3-isopropylmalate/(R)-2-methylmalate dehydratase large subunit